MAAITLHKFGILPEDEGTHVFTFIFENPQKLLELKSVESSEVVYGGHRWSIVCMRKEERYMGIYLKWRYSDGQSAPAISCKAKYTLSLIHRFDYADNKYFASNQKFTTSQSLLGKSKYIQLTDLLDMAGGFLDETGKRVVLELTLSRCSTRYEKSVDISPSARTKKNASGYYFDTNTFVLANHRWYLRVYPTKANASGLPAVYLYLASKPKGLSLEVNFRLYLSEDTTELLTYHFGEGAKFDGFGKTLSQVLYNVEKLATITVGAEVTSMTIWKDYTVNLREQNVYTPHLYKDYAQYRKGSQYGGSAYGGLTPVEAFQDQEGNFWKADIDRKAKKLTLIFDKGVHHYQQNKTKLLCWSATLVSRDPDRANDQDMSGEPIVGYFSNFIDEKGYRIVFPVDMADLEDRGSAYVNGTEILLRFNLMSLQTVPIGMRTIPRFDYQARHLLRARRLLQERSRNLEDMKEMAASRASLSYLDTSRDDVLNADNASMISGKIQLYKSYDSLDALSTGDMMHQNGVEDDFGKAFFSDFLRHIAQYSSPREPSRDSPFITSRDQYCGTREDVSTESGVTVSDESSLLIEARPSPVDTGKQKEVVATLIKFLQQRMPIRITETLQFGSVGCNTSTRSRSDVDLIFFSPDLPSDGHESWLPALLNAASSFVQNACSNPDPFYPLPKCSQFSVTPNALQFTCGGMDVDIMFAYDWDIDEQQRGGYNALYQMCCKESSIAKKQWLAVSSARLQRKFVNDQPNEVKEIIKVVKHWRNCTQWKKAAYRPNSYLLSLLVVKAVEDMKSTDLKKVLQRLGALVLSPELSLTWNTFYVSEKFPLDFEPPTPLVRDPANPGNNVAASLSYWGQFKSELILWMKALGVNVCNVDS